MIQKVSLCVLVLMVSSVFCAPGVKLKGNSMMIKLVKDAVVSFVQQNAALNFDDMTEMQELGNETYTYNLINTELASVDFNGAAKITALYPRTLAFHTTTLTIVLSGTYQVRLADSIVEDGPFTITFSDSNVVTHIELTNVNDFLAATATNCLIVTKPGVLDVDGLSPGHLKSLKYTVEQNLNSNSLNTVMCSTLRTYLGQSVNTFFTTRLGGLPIISTIKMDASLYGQPIVGRNSLQVAVSGKCYPGNDSSISYPYLRTALHDFTSSDQMLKVMVGKYTIETLL
uniref:Lipid-binding serum glycoprotein N-terminal domain-containing protein n=1 Tax=Ciona savignyi TaxID=51511 RepID=H2ZFY9_CIOSA